MCVCVYACVCVCVCVLLEKPTTFCFSGFALSTDNKIIFQEFQYNHDLLLQILHCRRISYMIRFLVMAIAYPYLSSVILCYIPTHMLVTQIP
jgi:hypothetical protein